MADYTLPDLPYDYGALDPHISGKIMELHHGKHHQNYVNGLNTALEKLEEARASATRSTRSTCWRRTSRSTSAATSTTRSSGRTSPPRAATSPTASSARRSTTTSARSTRSARQFEATALGIQGSGWAITAWDTLGQKLVIVQLYDQQSNIPATLIPISQLDMWEHAFYLDYLNVKGDYVKAWWNIVNWADAQERFTAATWGGQVLF